MITKGERMAVVEKKIELSLAHAQILRMLEGTEIEEPMTIDQCAAYLRTTVKRAKEIELEARARRAEIQAEGKTLPEPVPSTPDARSFEQEYRELFKGRPAQADASQGKKTVRTPEEERRRRDAWDHRDQEIIDQMVRTGKLEICGERDGEVLYRRARPD